MKTIGIDISVLNDNQRTGIGVYTDQLIKALLRINKKDKFILFGITSYENYGLLKNIEFKDNLNVELKIFKLPKKIFRRSFVLWQKINWPGIEKLVGKVDLFHSFNWYLPPQKFGKSIATVFDMTPILFPQFHKKQTVQLEKLRLKRIKEKADLVVTISENSKADFLNFAPDSRVEVIFPSVSDIFTSKKVSSSNFQNQLKPGYIIAVGTLEPRKNIRGLIKAYLDSKIKEKLVLVGDWGWERNDLFEILKKNKEKIITTGFINEEELYGLYRKAGCLVYPSFYEGFGMPILEAMSLGVPVICSNTSSLKEVGGDAPLYIDPKNLAEITRALVKIVKGDNLRKNMVSKGFKQVRKFSWDKSAKKLDFLYQQL